MKIAQRFSAGISCRPCRGSTFFNSNPALKRWAIVIQEETM
jgi:hypothetical protein